MASPNAPYIAKASAPLVNPTTATAFLQAISPIATVAATQVQKIAYVAYKGYAQSGSGVSNNIDIVVLNVRAAGRITFGAAGNFTPTLVIGNTAVNQNFLPANTVITLGSLTPSAASAAGAGTWELEATLVWDPNSGLISGTYRGVEATLIGGTAAQTLTAIASITPVQGFIAPQPTTVLSNTTAVPIPAPTGELALYFAVTGIFSASNANNQATQDSFQTEPL